MMLKADIPFSRDDANRFLPWMIALMCAIAALMLCTGLTLRQWVGAQERQFSGSVTLQVPHQGERQAQVLKQATALLEKTPGVRSVSALTEREVRALVEPWLGNSRTLEALSLPSVVDVVIDPRAKIDFSALEKQIQTLATDATLDTREAWVEKFARLSGTLQAGLYALSLCVVAALTGMMVFTARAAMKLHAATVQLLHAVGADDRYIAGQFQANALSLALRGAIPGVLCAGALYMLFGVYVARLDTPFVSSFTLGLPHALVLAMLPLACAAVSMLAVRMATLAQLKLLP